MSQRVYFARCVAANGADMEAIKIGCSWGVTSRLKSIEANVPFDCQFLTDAPGDMFVESAVHMWFRGDRIAGEYFRSSPSLCAFIEEVRQSGEIPLRIRCRKEFDGPWITMDGVRAFMARHGLTVHDIVSVSGGKVVSCEMHMKQAERPNRRFAAALTVAALERGKRVRWPEDFAVPRAQRAAA
jgi:hypothetical protein